MAINFENSIFLPDNNKVILGTGSDLQIYHDGSNSYVKEDGTGSLILAGYNLKLEDNVGGRFLIGTKTADVALYYNDVKKFETTNTGISVTGGVTTSSSSSLAGANMSAGIAMGTNAITGMADPSSAQDAATKAYVDSQISGVPQGTVTSVATGSGLTGGPITSSGTISVDSTVIRTTGNQTKTGNLILNGDYTLDGELNMEGGTDILLAAGATLQIDGDGGSGKYLKSGSGGLEWATVTTGTVTSVGITAGTGISVSGSPITSSGSITVTNTITNNNQLTNGAGYTTNTGTVTSIATTSPITGGTITGSGTIAFDSTAVAALTNLNTTGTIVEGVWNSNRKFNKTSTTDFDYQGDVVYWTSTTVVQGKIYVYSGGDWVAADADAESTSKGTLAIALGSGSSSSVGMLIRGTYTLNTDPGSDGDLLYLSTNAGNPTTEPPSGTGKVVRIIGQLIDGTNGQIWFNPDFTFITLS